MRSLKSNIIYSTITAENKVYKKILEYIDYNKADMSIDCYNDFENFIRVHIDINNRLLNVYERLNVE